MKRIAEWRFTEYGVDHEQFFPGHGIAHTPYTDCATGVGDTAREAVDDALEFLAQNDWETDGLDREIQESFPTVKWDDVPSEISAYQGDDEPCPLHVYVSIDVRGE